MAKKTNQVAISVSKNSYVDNGDGLVTFPNGLVITDDTEQRNGTKYDIATMDISQYGNQLTADHNDSLETLIGKVQGVAKRGNQVVISGIQYAVKQSAKARLAYDLLLGGFSNSFSIETVGPYPDDSDRTYYHAELVGLSQVVLPNNYNAKLNQLNEIVHNSLERSKSDGLDTSEIEKEIQSAEEESMTEEEKQKLAAEEAEKQAAEEKAKNDAEAEAKAKEEADAKALAEKEEAEKKEAEEKAAAEAAEKEEADKKAAEEAEAARVAEEAKAKEEAEAAAAEEAENAAKKEQEELNKKENQMTKEEIAALVSEAVTNALKPVQEELSAVKTENQALIDAAAKEPEFRKAEEEKAKNELDALSSDELFHKQLNAAVAVERLHDVEAQKTLTEINVRNLNALKEKNLVKNSLTLSDLGNFVISPELYSEIATVRNDYTQLLTMTTWKETNSIDFGWLTRSSDIDMKSVPIGVGPDQTGDRLKPISTPGYGANTDRLEEMAAVTPISINVIKFAAADILGDIAEGYRSDYDRKRAQLIVARLQQAVDSNGQVQSMDLSDGLVGWAQTVAKASDATATGTLIFNNKTKAFLIGQAVSTNNAAVLQEVTNGTIFGTPFVTVPNDMLPTINTNETRTFLVHGSPVTITYAVFYAELSTFTGRVSGGLKYDVDGSASYEVDGTVYSAYQRNEVVLRGSFFRGGVVKDTRLVAAINAVAVS